MNDEQFELLVFPDKHFNHFRYVLERTFRIAKGCYVVDDLIETDDKCELKLAIHRLQLTGSYRIKTVSRANGAKVKGFFAKI